MAERGSERAVTWAESHSLELKAPPSSSWEKALLVLPHLQASSGERIMMAIICVLSMTHPCSKPSCGFLSSYCLSCSGFLLLL